MLKAARIRYFFIVFALAGACNLAHSKEDRPWVFSPEQKDRIAIDADGKIVLRQFSARRSKGDDSRFHLAWAVLPMALYRPRVVPVVVDNVPSALEKCDGDLAISGGYQKAPQTSKGLVVADGKQISPPFSFKGGGAFVVAEGKAQIVRQDRIQDQTNIDQALQSTPIVIYGGQFDGGLAETFSWNRLGVGVLDGGDIVVALIHGPDGTNADFGQMLVALSSSGLAPKIDSMLVLDSATSGAMRLRRSNLYLGSERSSRIPNIICFEARSNK